MTEESGTHWESTRKAWDEVGNRFSDLGRRLGDQYRRLGEERGSAAQEEARRSMKDALQVAMQQVDQAFTSVGNAMRDPESKQELQNAARSFADAVSSTFADLSSQIREQFGSTASSGPDAPPTGDPGTKGDDSGEPSPRS